MNAVENPAGTQKPKKNFWKDYEPIEKMTFIMASFTVVYSLITCGLYIIANHQIDIVRKDQRPWVKIQTQVQPPPEKGTTLIINSLLGVTGKSPAKSVAADFFVERVKNGEVPQLTSSNKFAGFTTGVIFPDTVSTFPAPYDLLQSEMEDYKEGRIFLVVYGQVRYTDVFRTDHWTKFCGFISGKTGAFTAQKCTDYNDTDSN